MGIFSQEVADRKFARLVGQSTISFRQATSSEFKDFVMFLNSSYKHPSRQTLVKNIQAEVAILIPIFKEIMQQAPIVCF